MMMLCVGVGVSGEGLVFTHVPGRNRRFRKTADWHGDDYYKSVEGTSG
jgi:hypothetical protein